MPDILMVAIITGAFSLALHWFDKYLERKDPFVRARDYRAEIKELHDRIVHLEDEVDEWRSKYYRNEEEIVEIRKAMLNAGISLPARPSYI